MKYESRLLVDKGIALYMGKSLQTNFHSHHVLQIAIIIKGTYAIYIGEHIYRNQSVLIQSNVKHKHSTGNGVQLSLFIDPMSNLGRCLRANYPSDFLLFDAKPQLVNGLLQAFSRSCPDTQEIKNLIIKAFNLQPKTTKIDSRISQLLEQIEASNFEGEKIGALCAGIYLSESRIRHLFKQQTGISIKRYCLWGKIRKALYYISQGESLIQAAYHANFSDYAHLSRTVKEMFGLNLKNLLKDSHSVQENQDSFD